MVVGNVEHQGLFPFSPHTFWGIAWRKKIFYNKFLQNKVCLLWDLDSIPCPCSLLLLLLLKADMVVGNVEHWGLFVFSPPELCCPHTFWDIAWRKKKFDIEFLQKSLFDLGFALYSLLMMLQLKVLWFGGRKCGARRPLLFFLTLRNILEYKLFENEFW